MNPQQYPPQPGQNPQGYPPQGPPVGPGGYPQQPLPGGPVPPYPQGQAGQQPGMAPPVPTYNPYDFATSPAFAPHPVKKGPNKSVIIVIAVLGLLTVLIAALTLGASGGSNTGTKSTQDQATATTTAGTDKEVSDRSDGTLDLESKITLSKSLKAQKVQGTMKQQLNLSSGFSFMVNKAEDYTSPNESTKPAIGKKFIVVTTVVGNRLSSGNLSVSYLDFRLRDADNNVIPGHVVTNELLNNPLSSPTEIKPGAQINGKIVFEVDANDTSWVFKHTETYQKTTDNTTFEVAGEIVVNLGGTTTDTTQPTTAQPTTTTTPSSTQTTTTTP